MDQVTSSEIYLDILNLYIFFPSKNDLFLSLLEGENN